MHLQLLIWLTDLPFAVVQIVNLTSDWQWRWQCCESCERFWSFVIISLNLFTMLNAHPLLSRSLRTSTYCVSCAPGTSTWTRRERSFASRWPGGSSTRWTTCWRPGAHHRSSRTTTPGAGTTMTEVGLGQRVPVCAFCIKAKNDDVLTCTAILQLKHTINLTCAYICKHTHTYDLCRLCQSWLYLHC